MFWTIISLLAVGAIVNGPLFSLDASGAIGKALVYTKWKGRNIVREYVTPANPNSILQRGRRTMVSILNLIWQSMSQTEKDSWLGLAASENVSTFNSFTGYNLDRQTGEQAPQTEADVSATAVPGVDTLTATGGVNRVEFDPVAFGSQAGSYVAISLAEGATAPGQDFARIVGFLDTSSATTGTVTVTDLPAGIYSATAWQLNDTGDASGAVANQTAFTVTGV